MLLEEERDGEREEGRREGGREGRTVLEGEERERVGGRKKTGRRESRDVGHNNLVVAGSCAYVP